MGRLLLQISAALALAAGPGCGDRSMQTYGAVVRVSAPADARPEGAEVYKGTLADVRPAWGYLVLTVGEGKAARDLRLDMSEARIVGPSGNEWKGQDLRVGDRVRIDMPPGGGLIRLISVLPDRD